MKEKIKFEAEINLVNNQTKVKPLTGNAWLDWGICLEVCGMMAQQARTAKNWTFDQTADYARDYIYKCLTDYQNQ